MRYSAFYYPKTHITTTEHKLDIQLSINLKHTCSSESNVLFTIDYPEVNLIGFVPPSYIYIHDLDHT